MAALAFLHSVKRYSPGQFALFRVLFGGWLAWHFAQLAPWAAELFSAEGAQPDPALHPAHGRLPNPLAWLGAPWFSVAWCLLGAALALLLAAGWRRVPVALALWFVWAALFNRNVLAADSSTAYVGLLLLLVALVPDGEAWRWRGKARAPAEWGLPAGVFFAAWALMALGYAFGGWMKLRSPSWLDGSAFTHLLHHPLALPGGLRDALLSWPAWTHVAITWTVLAAEIAFLPLCFTRRGRAWAWSAMVATHLALLLVMDTADLAFGLLLLHAFTFDPDWLPPRARPGRQAVLLYDGECGLCNATVRFLLREDDRGVLRYAPLQGRLGQRTLKRFGLPTQDFDSILFLPDRDGDRRHLRTRGVIGVLDLVGGPWRPIAWALWWVPGPLRDLGYKLVARTRHRLFGPHQPSPLPDPRWETRFIPDE
jgi:predicted DCC family thiol-disulfide oxidoreductase YuxK